MSEQIKTHVHGTNSGFKYTKLALKAINKKLAENPEMTISEAIDELEVEVAEDEDND